MDSTGQGYAAPHGADRRHHRGLRLHGPDLPRSPARGPRGPAARRAAAPRSARQRVRLGQLRPAAGGARRGRRGVPPPPGAGADDGAAGAPVPRGRAPRRGQALALRARARVPRALHEGDPRPRRPRADRRGAPTRRHVSPALRGARPGGLPSLADRGSPRRRARRSREAPAAGRYLIWSYTLNIGRYIAITMKPTMPPTITI